MTIQWFPGHMTKARRQIEQKLKMIDIVIELLDARIPFSSRNPMIDEILQGKPRIIVLNKADLADANITDRWIRFFAEQHIHAIPLNATSDNPRSLIVQRSKQLLHDKIERQRKKGMKPQAVRALIVGIPNVGKSTLINRLAGRNVTATGDRPGVTKGQQWIKVGQELELLDTPGILWPKFDDPEVGKRLAVTGAIRDEVLHREEIAFYLMRYLMKFYRQELKNRFKLADLPEWTDAEDPQPIIEVMEEIGRKRGCLQSGGTVHLGKASDVILREFRSGNIGRISLEQPENISDEPGGNEDG